MKKLFLLVAAFAAGFAVTSCSSDKDVAVDPTPIENGGVIIILLLVLTCQQQLALCVLELMTMPTT